jgi:hypothetical protein
VVGVRSTSRESESTRTAIIPASTANPHVRIRPDPPHSGED